MTVVRTPAAATVGAVIAAKPTIVAELPTLVALCTCCVAA
jgi:hypothetical protein